MNAILTRNGAKPRGRPAASALAATLLFGATAALPACAADSPARQAEPAIALPEPRTTSSASLEAVLRSRRSIRVFHDEALSRDEIGQLLWAAQGITDEGSGHRASPSAGALYPLEAYAVGPEGVFHHLPRGHRIERVLQGDLRAALARAALGQSAIELASVSVVLTGVVARTSAKYGDRAERFVHIEAGHAAQNILLQATALGLGAVPIGGFDDEDVRALLALPIDEQPLYIIAVGKP
jgi:SagB-type dehydrogenase family enzyme